MTGTRHATQAHCANLTHASRPVSTVNWVALGCMALALAWLVKQPAALETSGAEPTAPASAGSAIPDFRALDTQARKTEFFDFMRPIAARVSDDVKREREALRAIAQRVTAGKTPSRADRETLIRLARDYGVDAAAEAPVEDLVRELTERVDTIPTSLVLVQAAKESGWGTSRFAIEGNGFFGERCYEPGCGIAPAALKNPKFSVERFASVADSVRSYVRNINTHPRYEEFRQTRRESRERGEDLDGIALAATLDAYSERRDAYVTEIASLIAQTGLPAKE
jgi:Bax protein